MGKGPAEPGDRPRWLIAPIPERGLHRTKDGDFSLSFQISCGGEHMALAPLTLTPEEAEQLHAALCYALDGLPVPDFAPECRNSIQRRPGGRGY
ncbi:hypothetical protein E4099_05385 [Streptomyces palmae]|uniref:Uncharacterized protein n=1 Tax=Streptomyces palmae TaxID=1701085 RepID=A0A4Z0HHR4_9ACTN|nr:hypothetical protein E4099_05385 [Streptomyces palmae]